MTTLLLILALCAQSVFSSTIGIVSSRASRIISINTRRLSTSLHVNVSSCSRRTSNRPKFEYVAPELLGKSPEDKLVELSKIHLTSEKIIQEAFHSYQYLVKGFGSYPFKWWGEDVNSQINESSLSQEQRAALGVRLGKYDFEQVYKIKKAEVALIKFVRTLLPDAKDFGYDWYMQEEVVMKIDPDFCEHVLHVYRRTFIDKMIKHFKAPTARKLIAIWNSRKHDSDIGYPGGHFFNTPFIVSDIIDAVENSGDAELIALSPKFQNMLFEYFSFTAPFLAALALHDRIPNEHHFEWLRRPHLSIFKKAKRTFENE